MERKLAELKMHGLGQARYRGQRKTLLQLRLTAGMINIKKLFALDAASRPHRSKRERIGAPANTTHRGTATDRHTLTPKPTSSAAT